MAQYGLFLVQCRFVAKDIPAVFEMIRASAQANSSGGMVRLGKLYLEGIGVPRDPRQAASRFRKAADAGNPEAAGIVKEPEIGALLANGG
jgi:TPR repeat protein